MAENKWKNRIVSTGEEVPDQLLANPKNWRIHPEFQQKALKGVLDKVGWVQQVIVNKRTGHMIDGHLRVTLAMREGIEKVPVNYVDISEEEEKLILATLDPLTSLAVADDHMRDEILNDLGIEDPLAEIDELDQIFTMDDLLVEGDIGDPSIPTTWLTAIGQTDQDISLIIAKLESIGLKVVSSVN